MLGVTTQTIRNWESFGRIRSTRHPVNGYRLFNIKDIEQLLESTDIQEHQQLHPLESKESQSNNQTIKYFSNASKGTREVNFEGVVKSKSYVTTNSVSEEYNCIDYDIDWLRLMKRPIVKAPKRELRIGDAFCGGGVFSLGVDEALRSINVKPAHTFGVDFNEDAIDTFAHNFPHAHAIHEDILSVANGEVGSKPTDKEINFLRKINGGVDILVGGPPCQGHSDLNNHTRRLDPKNQLYFSMVRLAELLNPNLVILENVPGVIHDKNSVVSRTEEGFRSLGYHVTSAKIDLWNIGVPQKRKRFVLVASKLGPVDIDEALSLFLAPVRPVSWALSDLLDVYDDTEIYNSSSTHSKVNRGRIEYLFAHDLYELPDAQRPPCHRDKAHSYKSVYGRMRWDNPAPTITGGFGSTGQGRFVHPRFPRSLTPHEACRVQFIPDFFKFPLKVKRRSMQQIIGNAAPPKLSFALVLGAAIQGALF